MITPAQLQLCYHIPIELAEDWAEPLSEAMDAFKINTRERKVDFLAQIGHESNRLKNLREIWGPNAFQLRYERNFEAAWPPTEADPRNHLAFRLGNENKGDGYRLRGVGPLQCTGGKNLKLATEGLRKYFGAYIVPDFWSQPELLMVPKWGAHYAGWFWVEGAALNLSHAAIEHCGAGINLNDLADAGDFLGETLAINGGTNGLEERKALRNEILAAI